jgi:hypothetical protein
MKSILTILLITFIFSGCQESDKRHIALLNSSKKENEALQKKLVERSAERVNRLELSKIDAKTKIEIAKIESQSKLGIAKVSAEAQKSVAQTDATTKIKTSEIDSLTKKEDLEYQLYITLAVIVVVLIALLLLYFNNKRSRELKNKLHKDQLEHERALKERELEERRLHKVLELVGKGKLSKEVEQEVLLSLTKPKEETVTLIESK